MTDNEIIKALEYCNSQGITSECEKCKVKKGCRSELLENALDLINRQKAEIKKLQNILLAFMDEVAKWEAKKGIDVSELPLIPICDEGTNIIDHYKAEAIKEFAERLKNATLPIRIGGKYNYDVISKQGIDHILKEMAGETK